MHQNSWKIWNLTFAEWLEVVEIYEEKIFFFFLLEKKPRKISDFSICLLKILNNLHSSWLSLLIPFKSIIDKASNFVSLSIQPDTRFIRPPSQGYISAPCPRPSANWDSCFGNFYVISAKLKQVALCQRCIYNRVKHQKAV